MAEPARDDTRLMLNSTVKRWAIVIRAALASTWVLVAPWLAALVART
ncbi:MAG TPA: hypothetical protein VFM77_08215 [Terriglobales bacterium]|nr:hypothetical protein [Terriglobales bacterium]